VQASSLIRFRDFAALVGPVAAVDRVFHAMGYMILKNLFFDSAKRGADGGDLGDDVDAVPVLVDHLREPANLAFDPVKAFLTGSLDVAPHEPYIPP
ncbi:hypothetical protein E4T56_gene19821, partial [Termitomyces sp. T112]